MNAAERFIGPSDTDLDELFGASWSYVLSDLPRSFETIAASGESVRIYVTEHPDAVDVDVVVHTDGRLTYRAVRHGASRLAVSAHAPEIVVESTFGSSVARLEIDLHPGLAIRDVVGREGPGITDTGADPPQAHPQQ